MAITILILSLALGTLLQRFVPLAMLSRVSLPAWAEDWLRMVPGAVLAASLAQALLLREGELAIVLRNTYILAAIPTFLVAWRTRNMIVTMGAGILSFALLERLVV